jgi:hypothetical protein
VPERADGSAIFIHTGATGHSWQRTLQYLICSTQRELASLDATSLGLLPRFVRLLGKKHSKPDQVLMQDKPLHTDPHQKLLARSAHDVFETKLYRLLACIGISVTICAICRNFL